MRMCTLAARAGELRNDKNEKPKLRLRSRPTELKQGRFLIWACGTKKGQKGGHLVQRAGQCLTS